MWHHDQPLHLVSRLQSFERWFLEPRTTAIADTAMRWKNRGQPRFYSKNFDLETIRLKFCKPPSAAKDVPLGEKEKESDLEKQLKLS